MLGFYLSTSRSIALTLKTPYAEVDKKQWEFPGGPVVKTLPSNAVGAGSTNPWSGDPT